MDAEAELCTRCGTHSVSYDYGASCCVCQNCGLVPPQQDLVEYREIADPQQGNAVGGHFAVKAAYGTKGIQPHATGVAAVLHPADSDGANARARRQRRELDDLERLAAILRLPGPVALLAAGFLARIHEAASEAGAARRYGNDEAQVEAEASAVVKHYGTSDSWAGPSTGQGNADGSGDAFPDPTAGDPRSLIAPRPFTGGQQSSARLGALLYLAARSERGTLTLAEVAMATCTDMFRVGEMARQQAAFLRLSLPSVDVERFVMRMARELVASGQMSQRPGTAAAEATAGVAAETEVGREAAEASPELTATMPVSATALWSHPLVCKTSQLTELVVRKGWHEGRSPRTVAGALLSICLDALSPQREVAAAGAAARMAAGGSGASGINASGTNRSPSTAQLSRTTMCAASQLLELKQEILGHLVRLAATLPFGPLVGRSNVATYLDVLIAADTVMEGIQQQQ
ncbi:hypothetical protein VaNZ11_001544 [Volvox africanus]|uniref:TFIIB-type domain-containing protein n=1 Tax=Volvox africanus TaxID=51714 RepID=A0ABQ5RPW6_9CHLO|nr:hypothetical protein VaNZ11_001544 [Volvox africanus]